MSFVTWLLSLLFAAPPSRPLWNLPSPVLEPSQPLRFLGLLSFQLLGLFLFCTLPLSFYLPFLSLESWASSTLPIKLFFLKKSRPISCDFGEGVFYAQLSEVGWQARGQGSQSQYPRPLGTEIGWRINRWSMLGQLKSFPESPRRDNFFSVGSLAPQVKGDLSCRWGHICCHLGEPAWGGSWHGWK